MANIIRSIMGSHRSGGPVSRFTEREPILDPFTEEGDAFARRWYGATRAGLILRQWATRSLNQYPPEGIHHQGGLYPDPREESAWGPQTTLDRAAFGLGVRCIVASQQETTYAEHTMSVPPWGQVRRAWLNIDPDRAQPMILYIRPEEKRSGVYPDETYFQVAMTLGYLYENWDELTGPVMVASREAPPLDKPRVVAILHQFAIALLHFNPECSPERHCQCRYLIRNFNARPPDHAIPTGSLNHEVQRQLDYQERVTPIRPHISTTWTNPNLGERRNTGA